MARLTTRTNRNILRYLYADGLNEIALGLFFLGMFGIRWADHRLDLMDSTVAVLPLLNTMVFIALMRVGVERLRERITYPRLGYARYTPRNQNQRAIITVISIGAAALTLAYALGRRGWEFDLTAALTLGGSLVTGLCWAWAGYVTGLIRFYVLAACTIAAPLALKLLDLPATIFDFPLFIVVQAGLLIAFGTWTLLKLLRMPKADAESDGDGR